MKETVELNEEARRRRPRRGRTAASRKRDGLAGNCRQERNATTNTPRAETRTKSPALISRKTRRENSRNTEQIAAATAAAPAAEAGLWIHVPHHLQCRRGFRRARRRHVPRNRDGLHGAAHQISLLLLLLRFGFLTTLPPRRLALQMKHLGRTSRGEIARRRRFL